jgi:hypothetical protein
MSMNAVLDFDSNHVPLRPDVARWATCRVRRSVLAVVHNVTSGQRLLEAVRLLEGDPRVQVFFTAAPDVFTHGVTAFLSEIRGLVLPWSEAVRKKFDLALAAGHGSLHELHTPVVVLPHGAGHNKYVSAPPGREVSERQVYGLSRQRLLRDGAVVPEAVVLSHEEELSRLGEECPEAIRAAEVIGDPCFDRMEKSLPFRARYRAALGLDSGQKLVSVCSTWGPHSLLARDWELLARLVTELPRHRYRVALMLHPNVWNAHGEWSVRSWFAWLGRRGLLLISQRSDWCGPLVAADHVVGDHGSVSLYGTMTDAPVLLAGRSAKSCAGVDPRSPLAELHSFAPRLNSDRSLCRQLDRSSASYSRERHQRVAARITSEPGRYVPLMRALIYRKLRLRPSAVPLTIGPAALPQVVPYDEQGCVAS